jgi:hypothetical protein
MPRIDLEPTEKCCRLSADGVNDQKECAVDPNPDYDISDELEYGVNWFAWILRGVYPPPAYPPA